jgi:hypothetical protein
MRTLSVPLMGRFGNQLFCYAFARAYALKHGYELCIGEWIGDKIFEIPKSRPVKNPDLRFNEHYHQDSDSLIYTRAQVRDWLKIKPHLLMLMDSFAPDDIVAHRRVGDYAGTGFPVVSRQSYIKAAEKFGYDPEKIVWITEENPTHHPAFKDYPFVPDFVRMMRARVLFRGNSTFSQWASWLGTAKTYSPVIDGLPGGQEVDCDFVEGNQPRCVNLSFVDNLHLKES